MTDFEYKIYLKVKRELLKEDARCFITDYLAEKNDCDPSDITSEMLDKYDYDYLVNEFEENEDCNVAFNDTWDEIIVKYLEDFEE